MRLQRKTIHHNGDSTASEHQRDGQPVVQEPERGTGGGWGLVMGLVIFRILNALLCSTSFVPDEYWQSLEVAHKMVFGYGYLTWEWQKAIRGYTHPLMFAFFYKLLSWLYLDWPSLLVVIPRVVVQAPLAAAADYHVFKLATLMYGSKVGWYALLWNLASWFIFYCITRTLSNSTEAALTPVVLYYWLLAIQAGGERSLQRYTRIYLIVMSISTMIRPTGAVMWVPLVGVHLVRGRHHLWALLKEMLTVGYFTQDAPSLLFTSLPLCLLGAWQSPRSTLTPFWVAMWNLAVLSCLGHKEHRFLLPVLPIASLYAGFYMANWLQKYKHKVLHGLVWFLLLVNVPMALYFSMVHQRGPTAVMDFLRKDVTPQSSILFLMPCHSTPFYSHLHQRIPMLFLECPPPIDLEYQDVAEVFYSDPEGWLNSHYPSPTAPPTLPTEPSTPSHIVMYDVLIPAVHHFMMSNQYKEVARLFHSHFPEGRRQGTHIVVFRRDSGIA